MDLDQVYRSFVSAAPIALISLIAVQAATAGLLFVDAPTFAINILVMVVAPALLFLYYDNQDRNWVGIAAVIEYLVLTFIALAASGVIPII